MARAQLDDAAAREAFETEAAREVGGGLGALLRYPSPVPQQVARETLR